jgi:hypothetical protein
MVTVRTIPHTQNTTNFTLVVFCLLHYFFFATFLTTFFAATFLAGAFFATGFAATFFVAFFGFSIVS